MIVAGVLASIALSAMVIALVMGWEFPIVYLVAITCVIGTSAGISYATLPTLIMDATPVEQTGEANGLNALMRIVGLAASAAVIGMILASSAIEIAGTDQVAPSESGYIWASAAASVAAVAAVVAAMFLPRKTLTR